MEQQHIGTRTLIAEMLLAIGMQCGICGEPKHLEHVSFDEAGSRISICRQCANVFATASLATHSEFR
jgi:ribosome-binding protein aMBF1 (putative translation factor)